MTSAGWLRRLNSCPLERRLVYSMDGCIRMRCRVKDRPRPGHEGTEVVDAVQEWCGGCDGHSCTDTMSSRRPELVGCHVKNSRDRSSPKGTEGRKG